MYKNVLIISDNLSLCKEFYALLQKKNFNAINFTFSISPFSKLDTFKVDPSVDVSVFNLKKQTDVDEIITNFDLIISIHCKQIFPEDLVTKVKCVNVHPGYNPINRGWYPQVFSIIKDLPIGATIHEIDKELDHGRVIARSFVEKQPFDTSGSLYNKIILKELELLDLHLDSIIHNNYQGILPENEGNLFLKKDFNDLLQLNLDETSTVGKTIDKLRALTHGDFKNAYFIDEKSGNKIFVSILLTPEINE